MVKQNRIKICILSSAHKRYDIRIFIKQAHSLYDAGYDVLFIIADGNGDEVKDGIKIYDVGKADYRLKRMLNSTKKVYKKALELDALIYHFHDPELMKAGLKLKKKGKKVIYDIHEDVTTQILNKHYIPKILRPIASFFYAKYEAKNVKQYDQIITVVDVIKERLFKKNKNITLVKNYPKIKEFINSTAWRQKQDSVCYVGILSKERGLFNMLNAVEKAKCKFNLAGICYIPEVWSKAKKLSAWNHTNFIGFANRLQVKELLQVSKIGLVILEPIPDYLTSLPVKMFEYMAAGLPVIASNFPEWRKIIEGANCGICVDPENTTEIADAIKTLLKNDTLAKEMGENGKNLVISVYNWANEEKKMLKIYSDLIKN